IVGGQAELPAEEAERAAAYVTAHADVGILAERNHRAPGFGERTEGFAHGSAGPDADSAALAIVRNALHARHVDDRTDLGVGDEILEAVSAAREGEPAPLAHRLLDGGRHLRGRFR